jgi:acyl dehydratase
VSPRPRIDEAHGPYFDDLEIGDRSAAAPALTLTDGYAAVHQAILGRRLRLPLDAHLARRVTGEALAHPALVCDVSIGQSTPLTQRVVANLFYRGLRFHRAPAIGDTLATETTVTALRQNTSKPGRAATGLAALHIVTVDQERRPVLDYHRCAMLPLRDPEGDTGHADDLDPVGAALDLATVGEAVAGWDLDALRHSRTGPFADALAPGATWSDLGGSVVSSAPELARLSLNIAKAHHDVTAVPMGRRLVYGGHTIGVAGAHLGLALPELATFVAWEHRDHLGPVFEGDTLHTDLTLEAVDGPLVTLHARVRASRPGEDSADVLDWRLIGVHP